jgi:predicted small secreted protein
MRYLIALLAIVGVVNLSACNTVEGLGQDIKKGGEAIEKAAK